MPLKSYDLIVIGTGSAALAVASRCREAGWTVAVIDSRPFGYERGYRHQHAYATFVGAELRAGVDRKERLEDGGLRHGEADEGYG